MDGYTRLTKAWLDNRYRNAFRGSVANLYFGHQPIYGLGNEHCEPNHARRIVRLLQQLLRVRAAGGRSLLDVGGSEGYFAQLCHELFGMTAMSVDLSTEACRRAAELFAMPGAAVDAASLPFATDSFDVVTCAEVVEHLSEPVPAILELQRVARGALVLATEEWLASATERDRELAERRSEPHGERSIFADADLRPLFAPYAVTHERQVVPDLRRFGDDRAIDRDALRTLLLRLASDPPRDDGASGIVLTARKRDLGPTPRVPGDAEIVDHLLQREMRYHLIGAPTPRVPWPKEIAARCVVCAAALPALTGDVVVCGCEQRYRRERGVFEFLGPVPPMEHRIDAMLADRGGAAYREQRSDLLALANKLELPFERRTSWSFADARDVAAWEWSPALQPTGPARFAVVGADPWLQHDGVGLEPEATRFVTLVMAVRLDGADAEYDIAEVHWVLDGQLGHRSDCSAGVVVVPDGTMRTYRFEAPPTIRGDVVISLRIDPLTFRTGTIELQSLRLDATLPLD